MPLLIALASSTFAEPDRFSLVEKLSLASFILTSAGLFWKRFGVVVDKILQSRKDPGFHLFPIGKRIWDFFWEVLCQAKVIRERPLPGLAHAFVFWSFLAFALVTLNHIATGFGIGFLDPTGIFGRLYFSSPQSSPSPAPSPSRASSSAASSSAPSGSHGLPCRATKSPGNPASSPA
jgi:hypothetical protein